MSPAIMTIACGTLSMSLPVDSQESIRVGPAAPPER
jgi:hypothetical protein